MKTLNIPEYWLIGATQSRERQGMSPKEALESAIECWLKQEVLEARVAEEVKE